MSLCKWALKGGILLCTAAYTEPVLRQDPGHGTVRGHREVSEHYELPGRLAGSVFFPRLLRGLCRCSLTSFIFRCQGSAVFHLSELS